MTTPTSMPPTVTLGGEEYAIVPRFEYDALRKAVEEDALDAAILQRILEDPHQEVVPFELVRHIVNGEHPVRVWREYRGMKAGELAAEDRNCGLLPVEHRDREKDWFGQSHETNRRRASRHGG